MRDRWSSIGLGLLRGGGRLASGLTQVFVEVGPEFFGVHREAQIPRGVRQVILRPITFEVGVDVGQGVVEKH
jgi:hypothetical protein